MLQEKQQDHNPERHRYLSHLRVLVVEDDLINRTVVLQLLASVGWVVDTAENGEAAVAMAEAYPYDLILMDIIMPVMDGRKATSLIQSETGLNRNTPVVAMTGDVSYHDLGVCRNAGMKDFIAKPVNKGELFRKIMTWVKEPPH